MSASDAQHNDFAARVARLQKSQAHAPRAPEPVIEDLPERRQAGPERSRLPMLIGLAAVLVLFVTMIPVVDFLMFRTASAKFNKPSDVSAYVDYRFGTPEPVETGPRDFAADPMTLADKRRFSRNINDTLPAAPAGWVKRDYVEDDYWALRPDMANCKGRQSSRGMAAMYESSITGCPSSLSGDHVVVYEKGHKRIAVLVTYSRGMLEDDNGISGKIRANGRRPGFISANINERRTLDASGSFMRRGSWVFKATRRTETLESGRVVMLPHRIVGYEQKDGTVLTFVVSNASIPEIKSVVRAMDYEVLNALLAPLPAEG